MPPFIIRFLLTALAFPQHGSYPGQAVRRGKQGSDGGRRSNGPDSFLLRWI